MSDRGRAGNAAALSWRHSSSQALALRSRIVLAVAEGGANTAIAAELGVNQATVAKWRHIDSQPIG